MLNSERYGCFFLQTQRKLVVRIEHKKFLSHNCAAVNIYTGLPQRFELIIIMNKKNEMCLSRCDDHLTRKITAEARQLLHTEKLGTFPMLSCENKKVNLLRRCRRWL